MTHVTVVVLTSTSGGTRYLCVALQWLWRRVCGSRSHRWTLGRLHDNGNHSGTSMTRYKACSS